MVVWLHHPQPLPCFCSPSPAGFSSYSLSLDIHTLCLSFLLFLGGSHSDSLQGLFLFLYDGVPCLWSFTSAPRLLTPSQLHTRPPVALWACSRVGYGRMRAKPPPHLPLHTPPPQGHLHTANSFSIDPSTQTPGRVPSEPPPSLPSSRAPPSLPLPYPINPTWT